MEAHGEQELLYQEQGHGYRYGSPPQPSRSRIEYNIAAVHPILFGRPLR